MRTSKFIPRKQWVVCGADDMFVRVYNYNTMDKVKQFEAHTDYIRRARVGVCGVCVWGGGGGGGGWGGPERWGRVGGRGVRGGRGLGGQP